MNALQAYIAETRNDMNRKHGDKMDKDATHMLLDAAEEWSWGAPGDDDDDDMLRSDDNDDMLRLDDDVGREAWS